MPGYPNEPQRLGSRAACLGNNKLIRREMMYYEGGGTASTAFRAICSRSIEKVLFFHLPIQTNTSSVAALLSAFVPGSLIPSIRLF